MSEGPIFNFLIRAILSGIVTVVVSGMITGVVYVVFMALGAEDKINSSQVYVAIGLSSWLPWHMYFNEVNK